MFMKKAWVDAQGVPGYPATAASPLSSIAASIPEYQNQQLAARASLGGSLSFFFK